VSHNQCKTREFGLCCVKDISLQERKRIVLVVISDLHLIDGTIGNHNVPPEWFKHFFCHRIPTLAKERSAKELKVLLMGDIVDLIRTEQWLDVDHSIRPWGESGRSDISRAIHNQPLDESKTEEQCLRILGDPQDLKEDTILYQNQQTFNLFKKDCEESFIHKIKQVMEDNFRVEIIYLPGNHDRLCNLYPSLRDWLREQLNLTVDVHTVEGEPTGDWWYPYQFRDEAYGVFARHGHEYDPWNYGNPHDFPHVSGDYPRVEQLQVPIGDVIATEFAVKVPKLLREREFPYKQEVIENIEQMDNVRPASSVFEFFLSDVRNRTDEIVRNELENAFDQALKDLVDILKQHWQYPETLGGMIARVFSAPQLKWFCTNPHLMPYVERLFERLSPYFGMVEERLTDPTKDIHTRAAYNERIWKQDNRIRYILYGHTHNPLIHPLELRNNGGTIGEAESVYINTGTWRNRILRTVAFDQSLEESPRFVPLQQLTYVVFYREDEDPGKAPQTTSFDMWTGSTMTSYMGG
jgi:UDP-2,3-diacylglucosamine pyrophosphatase LpxH